MKLKVLREPTAAARTYGLLLIDGVFECQTLEDPIREIPGVPVEKWKIAGDTAIPAGTFEVELYESPHFGFTVLLFKNVPGFTAVEFHPGNVTKDTRACLLPGLIRTPEGLASSRIAFGRAMEKVEAAFARGEKVTIEFVNPPSENA